MNAPMTVLLNRQQKTDITDKTVTVGNSEFLRGVFGSTTKNYRPIIVSFRGNPNTVTGSNWYGSPWIDPGEELSPTANNYFSLSVFKPFEEGRYNRQKKNFEALHAIVLDDLGTKVSLERLTLQPSWMLETSLDNYQAGYLLAAPLSDGQAADRLMQLIVAAGLSDPGANGPRSRLARLPVGSNGKHEPPFSCRMVTWAPEKRYSVQEIIDGLDVKAHTNNTGNNPGYSASASRAEHKDLVWIKRPDKNPVLEALRERGLYKSHLGQGKHEITCPWLGEHTNSVDSGSAYFEPNENWPIGGFNCFHGHCTNRGIGELLNHVGVDVGAARMKSSIRVIGGEIHRVVEAAERELAGTMRIYQRGGLIVSVITDPGSHETKIQTVTQSGLLLELAAVVIWERYDARSKEMVGIDPPARHVAALLDRIEYAHLPILMGLARQPYLRSDGSLMLSSGFDKDTGMYGIFNEHEFSVPENPSRTDAELALNLLKDLLIEFSFADLVDLAAGLSAILTAVIRPTLKHAPMVHVKAHTAGSGKTYLCELITAFATFQHGKPIAFPADDEECRKLLIAELLQAPAVIEFDNLTSDLVAYKSLCTALTSEFMSGRILGVSKSATVNTRTLFLSSGNNVSPVQDMARRCITIHLDPGCEVPSAREFKRPNLVRDVQHDRGHFVSLALTIVRAWIVSGRPKSICKPLASFGEWSDLCRQPLLWLGLPDPAESIFEAIQEDPDRETLVRLLNAWRTYVGTHPVMVRDIVSRSIGYGSEDLREVLNDIASEHGEINRRRLGWWIKRHSGRIVDDMRIVRYGVTGSSERWKIEMVV